ncbi:tetratricopeptide repeat protein [Algibacter lectus]|uniref:Tetratricopeptide repeat protein n=2 Tax=Algibacter lectus TaxID=221126 RepID=A0A4R8MGI0_9FLAO|nr:tetratricopeptide repeat protein [Algibacter lectus]MWW23853.1 tetratricopeptide repeat protein [Algibacter lectus]TDY63462.1 tetratricopeptide repeat protein [Algibacter lectus]SFC46461.1 Tetratricopeptide repeat-containing protein [Algibacter lectus]
MKKQLIIALAISMGAFSFAQKKELKAVEKAIKSSDFAAAKAAATTAEGLLGAMDEKSKAKYYYLLGQALYADGKGSDADIATALESFTKAESAYGSEVTALKQTITNKFLTKGNAAYEKQDYSNASKYFEKSYRVKEKDTVYLYYAAATAVNVKEYDRALGLYEELKNLGYTGIQKQYFAINKETGEEEILDKATRDLYVKAKSHIKPGERLTESKKPEIVKNVALIYVSEGNNEKAIEAMKEARDENPDDVNLILSEANIHFKMGNTEKFQELLTKATELEPENAELQYNLGVIASQSDHPVEAKAYYEKAIELDPNYVNAYINISALVLAREEPLITEMNGLGSSKKDDLRYDELREERQNLYKEAVPFLAKALEIDTENLSAAKTLMNIYNILGESDKAKGLKAKVEALEGAQ